MNVICYGDSNTFGYDPCSPLGGRYDADCRWVDILAESTGWHMENRGLNGREIPCCPFAVPEDTDLMIVMLGTNDLLQGRSVEQAADRMENFLVGLEIGRAKLLLIAPPPMWRGEWVMDQALIDGSYGLAKAYQSLAQRLGIPFVDAGLWAVRLAYDGVHLTEAGHRAFATGLYQYFKKENYDAGSWKESPQFYTER